MGGGILGQATAWQLAKQRPEKASHMALVTMGNPSEGTTSQAAALVTHGRGQALATDMVQQTLRAVEELNQELELGVPFHGCGGLHIACSEAELAELQSMAQVALQQGLNVRWLSAQETQSKVPAFCLNHFSGALWFEEDGYIDPVLLANAYGESAKNKGVTFYNHSEVVALLHENGQIIGVRLSSGVQIFAEHVVLCAGPWAAKLLKPLGLPLPVTSVRSLYWMTEASSDAHNLPITIVPSVHGYFRKENQSVLFGVRDCPGISLHPDSVPNDVQSFAFAQDSDGLNTLTKAWDPLVKLWPNIENLGLANFIAGISSYSLDGLPVIGVPDVDGRPCIQGLTIVSGCSGAGVAYSAGMAHYAMRHVLGESLPDQLSFNRFSPMHMAEQSINEPSNQSTAVAASLCAYDEPFRKRCLQARYNKKAG